jgi:hypothetical protein
MLHDYMMEILILVSFLGGFCYNYVLYEYIGTVKWCREKQTSKWYFYFEMLYKYTLFSVKTKQTPWLESVSKLYRPSNHRLLSKLVPTFVDRGMSRSQGDGSPMAIILVL